MYLTLPINVLYNIIVTIVSVRLRLSHRIALFQLTANFVITLDYRFAISICQLDHIPGHVVAITGRFPFRILNCD
ncbi:hypothetical protein D3C78_652120 [compost metagenome]